MIALCFPHRIIGGYVPTEKITWAYTSNTGIEFFSSAVKLNHTDTIIPILLMNFNKSSTRSIYNKQRGIGLSLVRHNI